MSDHQDKAARLAAIRAQNAAKQAQAVSSVPNEDESVMSGQDIVGLLLAIVGGTLVATMVIPRIITGSASSTLETHAFWYLSRSSAIVSYILLWISMLAGLSITSDVARAYQGNNTMLNIHQHSSILGLAFAVFHSLILLGDKYSNYTLSQLLVPFGSSNYEPFAVGLGQIGIYMMIVVIGSFYVKRQIGRTAWRVIHLTSFGMFLLALAHGILSGTDTTNLYIAMLYGASFASTVFLTVYRVVLAVTKPKKVVRA